MLSTINIPHLFCGESEVESPSCKISIGRRLKEIFEIPDVEHRVTASSGAQKELMGRGDIEEFSTVENALWGNRKTSVLGEDSAVQD